MWACAQIPGVASLGLLVASDPAAGVKITYERGNSCPSAFDKGGASSAGYYGLELHLR